MSTKSLNRNRVVHQQKLILIISTTIVICMLVLVFNIFHNTAQASASTINKSYHIIMVEEGDTLWDLATKYKDTYVSTKDYIAELKSINGLASDQINTNTHLTIVIYE